MLAGLERGCPGLYVMLEDGSATCSGPERLQLAPASPVVQEVASIFAVLQIIVISAW